jgi:hypothetical protein
MGSSQPLALQMIGVGAVAQQRGGASCQSRSVGTDLAAEKDLISWFLWWVVRLVKMFIGHRKGK